MAANITLWGRRGDAASMDAQRFLKANRYGADEVRDLDATPPTPEELARIAKGLGGSLRPLLAPSSTDAPADDADLAAWLSADTKRMRSPVLLTPKGALAGFGERKWMGFLDIGKGR